MSPCPLLFSTRSPSSVFLIPFSPAPALLLPLLLFGLTSLPLPSADPNQEWDINWPCQDEIKLLSQVQKALTGCALINNSPPRVCTNCARQYTDFKHQEYRTFHLDAVLSVDNKSCTTVIYDNYPLSYAHDIGAALTGAIWEASRCASCLVVHWDLRHANSTWNLDAKTEKFSVLLDTWRYCVANATTPVQEQICKNCDSQFDALFDYYWKIYSTPGIDFCIDVESTMNDTMHLWQNVWGCVDEPSLGRHQDIRVVAFSSLMLAIVVALFYAGSYIQSEQAQANLIQYSRMQAPRSGGSRYRLLSSSTLDTPAVFHSPQQSASPSTSSTNR